MTCKNCGHTNPGGRLRCEECNAPLDGSMVASMESVTALSGEIRCNNCNTRNPVGALRCKECNVALDGSMVVSRPAQKAEFDATIKDNPISSATMNFQRDEPRLAPGMLACIRCAYPNLSSAKNCAQCGSVLENPTSLPTQQNMDPSNEHQAKSTPQVHPLKGQEANQQLGNATVNPWLVYTPQPKRFGLRPIAKQGEDELPSIEFTDNRNELSRDNLDPNNQTITGKLQAAIEWKDGQWYITNHSEQKTTFIRIEGEVALKKGDVILVGDRLFEFDC